MSPTSVRDIMTPEPRTVSATDRLTDAWTLLVNGGFHHLPVLDNGQLVGVLSASDLLERLRKQDHVLQDTGVVLDDAPIAKLMSRNIVAISADAPVDHAVKRLSRGDLHSLLVVEDGGVVGIVTATDLARMLLATLDAQGKA